VFQPVLSMVAPVVAGFQLVAGKEYTPTPLRGTYRTPLEVAAARAQILPMTLIPALVVLALYLIVISLLHR
jgi:hypothetical protein